MTDLPSWYLDALANSALAICTLPLDDLERSSTTIVAIFGLQAGLTPLGCQSM